MSGAPRAAVHYNSRMKEIFQPQLRLEIEPDGEYSLHATTICPNTAYSAGRARAGAPANVRLIGEAFPVILELRVRRGGPALQVLTPVRHFLRNLKLGEQHGKTMVTAFAMVGDNVVGTASIPVRPERECPSKDPAPVETADWYAWLDKMPPGPPSFHLTGVARMPTPGYEVKLVKAAPQGINPKELILDLQVTPLRGIWPQVITPMSLRYDERQVAIEYDGVLVREPDGDAVHFDVEIAH